MRRIRSPRRWPPTLAALAALGAALAACGDDPNAPVPPILRGEPIREWSFTELRRNATATLADPEHSLTGGIVDDSYDFGPAGFVVDGDARATGHVFSNATGETYWVFTEAPAGDPTDPQSVVGSKTELFQSQGFVKVASDATLTLTVTGVELRGVNYQGTGILDEACRLDPTVCEQKLWSQVDFQVYADTAGESGPGLFWGRSAVHLFHDGAAWQWQTKFYEAPRGLWHMADFTSGDAGHGTDVHDVRVRLKAPITIDVPLDAVAVGEEFWLYVRATAATYNTLYGESYVSAYFRDPASVGGTTVAFTGLQPTSNRRPMRALHGAGAAPACTGTAGSGGTLQFDAGPFRTGESPVPGPYAVTVTRTGGSAGRASVRLTTSDGTAAAGADYQPTDVVLAWADGDAEPRTVVVPTVLDATAEPDETVQLTLSDARGCATLGAASAELTIVDDDRPREEPPTYAIGGTVAGLEGSGLVLRNVITGETLTPANGAFAFTTREDDGTSYDVRVATQPSNPAQACAVAGGEGTVAGADVADIRVTCTTVAPVAGLDASFGQGGKVFDAEVPPARAVVVQRSGRIVVLAGLSLVAYDANGRRDPSFGAGGIAPVTFAGGSGEEAYGLTRQPDDRLIVVGRARVGARYQMAVKRFDADGAPDAGFGTSGLATIDPYAALGDDSRTSYAYRALVAPDGKIWVAGLASFLHRQSGEQRVNAAVARLTADGRLDAGFPHGFGNGAQTVDMGGDDWAEALYLQSDGKIVIAGQMQDALGRTHAAAARFRPDGTLDSDDPRVPANFGRDGSGISALLHPGGSGRVMDMVALDGSSAAMAIPLPKPHATLSSALQFGIAGVGNSVGSAQALSIGPESDVPRALARQADGKLLLVGLASSATTVGDFGIVRYNADLSLDTSFGTNGVLTVDFFGALDDAAAVAVQPDGRVVVAGLARNGASNRLGLVRLRP